MSGVRRGLPRLVLAILVMPVGGAAAREAAPTNHEAEVREALRDYPWYDAAKDQARGMWTSRSIEPPDANGAARVLQGIGQALVYLFFAALLVGIILLLIRYAARLDIPEDEPSRRGPSRRAARAGPLPAGVDLDESDPRAAFLAARRRGDLGRAVVLLFAHELRLLERSGLLRLLPGRTGRQLVRSVPEAEARRRVEPTLRMFELAYYGHRAPTAEQVDAAWADAQDLETLLAARAA